MALTQFEKTGKIYVPRSAIRRGETLDIHSLPNGAMVSSKLTEVLRKRILNDPDFRQNLLNAEKRTGKKFHDMNVLRHNMPAAVDDVMRSNEAKAEKIMNERIDGKDETLNKSGELREKSKDLTGGY
jgi:hypothetical protein